MVINNGIDLHLIFKHFRMPQWHVILQDDSTRDCSYKQAVEQSLRSMDLHCLKYDINRKLWSKKDLEAKRKYCEQKPGWASASQMNLFILQIVYLWLKVEIFLELQHGNPNKGNKLRAFLQSCRVCRKGMLRKSWRGKNHAKDWMVQQQG